MSKVEPLKFDNLTQDIAACQLCAEHLLLRPRPVFQANEKTKILSS